MRLGIGSYTYTWAVGVPGHEPAQPLTAGDLLRHAKRLGLRVAQYGDNLPFDALPAPVRRDVAARAADAGIQIEVGTRGIGYDHLCTYLDLARACASPILRVVVDTATHHPTPNEVIEALGRLAPHLAAAGVTLAIENHDRFSTQDLVRILRQVDGPVGICLDTVNSFAAGEGPAAVIAALAPWTVNLHVKDFRVTRVASQMGFTVEGAPAGQGQLDIPGLLAALRFYGRDPNAILELWTPPEATLEETLRKEVEWADASIQYLRTLIPEEE